MFSSFEAMLLCVYGYMRLLQFHVCLQCNVTDRITASHLCAYVNGEGRVEGMVVSGCGLQVSEVRLTSLQEHWNNTSQPVILEA